MTRLCYTYHIRKTNEVAKMITTNLLDVQMFVIATLIEFETMHKNNKGGK